MIRDRTKANLEEAIAFQVCLAEEICRRLENNSINNDIGSCF